MRSKELKMRYAFFLLMMVHGLIHLMGFAKAFKYAEMSQLTQPITKAAGLLWLSCAVFLAIAGGLFLKEHASWWWVALPAVVLSQALILAFWSDARFGTVANLIILLPLTAAALESLPGSYRNQYQAAARDGLARYHEMPLVTEGDLSRLPIPVQNYVRASGAVGKPQIHNFRAVFTGDFRNGLKGPWMVFRSQQYNFLDQPVRVFLMKASMYHLPTEGLHMFRGANATMQIKLASLLQVVDAKGSEMNRSETVTLFNDLCLLAPAALIDKQRIQWEADGPLGARARFTHMGNSIRARLTFNQAGDLTDFISDDRLLSADGKTFESYPWSTPVGSYKPIGGRKVMSYGEAVWHTPNGEFIYGKFNLAEIEYNLREFR
jgi:hypothetical protein